MARTAAVTPAWSLAGAGAVGAFVAVLSDLIGQRTNSTVFQAAQVLGSLGLAFVSPLLAAGLFIVLGALLALILEANSTKTAFYIGTAILATIMNLVPRQAPPPLPADPSNTGLGGLQATLPAPGQRSSLAPGAQALRGAAEVRVRLSFEAAPPQSLTVTLETPYGQPLHRSVIRPQGFTFYHDPGRYVLEFAAEGYSLTRCLLELSPDRRYAVELRLRTSRVPLFAQQLVQMTFRPEPCPVRLIADSR
ncbi:hypothetical protein Mterra_01973 [Calidithermus terrae]|uniref:Carboxypeptidase regulatory-like domain-containing protein n=1 Tax=Calidithermus terrae TaxID=1408545 RepID=A0A399EKH0_9DEIN|nr:hypothetical protein [Calidithermus terrae]RIH84478.1 hypothetical protein Mterra_01973 [Calidithermus terrae]